jgi:hypothetical protein
VFKALGKDLDAARLVAERNAATQKANDAAATAAASSSEVGRLRRALLDAELDTQRSAVALEQAKEAAATAESEAAAYR